nr:MAG TPA: hypothetical protein [Caudoviricetes sp.]
MRGFFIGNAIVKFYLSGGYILPVVQGRRLRIAGRRFCASG